MTGGRRSGPRLVEVVQLHRDCDRMLIVAGLAVAIVGAAPEWSSGALIVQLVGAALFCGLFNLVVRRRHQDQVTAAIADQRPMPADALRASRTRTLGHAAVYAGSIGVGFSLLLVFSHLLAGASGFSGTLGGIVMALGLMSRRVADAAADWERREGGRLWFVADSSLLMKPARTVPLYLEPLTASPAS